MIFQEQDFLEQSNMEINKNVIIPEELMTLYNHNIKNVIECLLNIKIFYQAKKHAIKVKGKIKIKLKIEDSRTLKLFDYDNVLDWNEFYFFASSKIKDNKNYLIDKKFDIISYAWDEVIVNVPDNLSLTNQQTISDNSSWKVISEQECEEIITKSHLEIEH